MSWQLDCKIRYYSCMCHIKVRGTVWLYIMHMDMIDGKGTTWCYVKAPANSIHLKKRIFLIFTSIIQTMQENVNMKCSSHFFSSKATL